MELLARKELGMGLTDFYNCTWYDWSLWLERIKELRERRLQDHELIQDMFRRSLSIYYNWNKGKSNPPVNPEDFWRLSYDKVTDTQSTMTQEELQSIVRKLESKSRRKRG
jgi:hypothetical protein